MLNAFVFGNRRWTVLHDYVRICCPGFIDCTRQGKHGLGSTILEASQKKIGQSQTCIIEIACHCESWLWRGLVPSGYWPLFTSRNFIGKGYLI